MPEGAGKEGRGEWVERERERKRERDENKPVACSDPHTAFFSRSVS